MRQLGAGGVVAVVGHMAYTAGRRALEAYGVLVEAAAGNLEEAVIAVLRLLPVTAQASSAAYEDILGWGLVVAKGAAYTWCLGLTLAVFTTIFRSGWNGGCARILLRQARKFVWPSPYAQSQHDERLRLIHATRAAVRGASGRGPAAELGPEPADVPAQEQGVWAQSPEVGD
eukprot:6993519-Alexandrium_andersonii.AAC.1